MQYTQHIIYITLYLVYYTEYSATHSLPALHTLFYTRLHYTTLHLTLHTLLLQFRYVTLAKFRCYISLHTTLHRTALP